MSVLSSRAIASGTGKPRIIKEMSRTETYATGTASQATTVITGVGTVWTANMADAIFTFADGTKVFITSVTDTTHMVTGASQTVTSQAYTMSHYPSEYSKSTGTTIIYSATSIVDDATLATTIKVGHRVRAVVNNSGFAGTLAYAKITAINSGAKTLTVDEWIGGTPTANNKYIIDGWIADLQRTLDNGLVETFEPDVLVHNLFRSKKSTKQFGYKYSATLNFDAYSSPDMLFDMRDVVRFNTLGTDETVILIPRKDKYQYNYNVFLSGDLSFGIHPSETGHFGLVLEFTGKNNVAIPPQFFFAGYGMGYGTVYGTGL